MANDSFPHKDNKVLESRKEYLPFILVPLSYD